MTQGKLLLIGGAEGKQGEREILSTFVHLAGGPQAQIYVIPSASEYPVETGQIYTRIFLSLGAGRVSCLPFNERGQTEHSGYTQLLEGATGYFFTGGQQARFLDVWQDSPAWEVIVNFWREHGAIIAGTSAGAAVLSERVILFSDRDQEKTSERIVVSEGMNLLSRAIIDQHFSQRSRLDRLLAVVQAYPELLGVGIDEDTAIVVDVKKDCFAVMGNHSVTVVDGYRQYRLLKGDQFHLALRTVIPYRS